MRLPDAGQAVGEQVNGNIVAIGQFPGQFTNSPTDAGMAEQGGAIVESNNREHRR